MKRFKICKSDGTSEIIEAERVEYTKKKDGLFLKFFTGRKVTLKFDGVVVLLEINPEIIHSTKVQNENQDD